MFIESKPGNRLLPQHVTREMAKGKCNPLPKGLAARRSGFRPSRAEESGGRANPGAGRRVDVLQAPVGGAFAPPQRARASAIPNIDSAGRSSPVGCAPRFTMSMTIVNNLVAIERCRGFLLGARLSPQWVEKMQDQALIAEAHHTTHIEGTALSFMQSEILLRGLSVPQASPDDIQELLNYRRAFDLVAAKSSRGLPVTEMMIREIHRKLVEGVRGDRAVPGKYRTVQNLVINSQTHEVTYCPPAAFEVPRLMHELVLCLRSDEETNPVIRAGIAQFQLVHIHPFLDGNGRAARLLSILVLYNAGYDFKRMLTISEYYDRDRSSYYDALQSVQSQGMDLTSWLEYFTAGLRAIPIG